MERYLPCKNSRKLNLVNILVKQPMVFSLEKFNTIGIGEVSKKQIVEKVTKFINNCDVSNSEKYLGNSPTPYIVYEII